MIVVAVDIGSTWTKGAAFAVDADEHVRLLDRAACPTTVHDLEEGFMHVLRALVPDDPLGRLRNGALRLQYSSSAKGGLAVAAIGLVPEVTLEIGKMAAQSAGARLTQVFSYQLTRGDIARLEETPPDILLFAGGTDGGNLRYVLDNAAALGASAIDCDIVYAGNRAAAEEVAQCLRGKRLHIVDNLMPVFNEANPEPARDALRRIFLGTIVRGKGLDRIVQVTGVEPVPTPLAMLEYVQAIRTHAPGWESFMLFDMGGATTDVYSAHREETQPGTLRRGLAEPDVKRTVEGDLGMRVSAQAAAKAAGTLPQASMPQDATNASVLAEYAERLARCPDHLPQNADEQRLDETLAGVCVSLAGARHAGRCAPVFTPEGEIQLQTGRDLRRIDKVIGSGGWLARASAFAPAAWLAAQSLDARGRTVLVPRTFTYFRDAEALFPLLANLAREIPRGAAIAGVGMLAH